MLIGREISKELFATKMVYSNKLVLLSQVSIANSFFRGIRFNRSIEKQQSAKKPHMKTYRKDCCTRFRSSTF